MNVKPQAICICCAMPQCEWERVSERKKSPSAWSHMWLPNDAYQLAVVKAREPTTLWRERNANVFRTISDEIQWKRNQHWER